MYSALMVDDEQYALEGMVQSVDWGKIGFEQPLTAYSINTAKQILLSKRVDIILCDIEMPGGSGLELMEWIREKQLDIICILVTCHEEFTYAHKAIKLQIDDYLLKPVYSEKLESVLLKAKEKIIKQIDDAGKKTALVQFWKEILFSNTHNTGFSGSMPYRPDDSFLFILFPDTDDDNALRIKAELSFLNPVVLPVDQGKRLLVIIKQKMVPLETMKFIHENSQAGNVSELRIIEDVSIENAKLTIDALLKTEDDRTGNGFIAQICSYIEDHITENIDRRTIANHFCLNSDYLSRLFKAETHRTIVDYIIECRIKSAKRMLKETDQSIAEIAEAIGYSNYSYFARIFREATGVRPIDYRRMKKK